MGAAQNTTAVLEPTGTLADAICTRVRSEILSGIRRPEMRIRLEDLKAEFNVSWSPLREALSRLVSEGLIQNEEGRGYRVAAVSRAQMSDIIRMRKAMESMALRMAIASGDDIWEAEVLAAHHRLTKVEGGRDWSTRVEQWEVRHRAYHDALNRGCGSPILLDFCAQLHDQFARYRKLFLASNLPDKLVPVEHKKLTDAALARDADKACSIIETHIERNGRNILAAIRE
jgi:DNA-binding GntR family transcriptional regulator